MTLVGRDALWLAKAQTDLDGSVQVVAADVTREGDLQRVFAGCGPVDHLVTAASPLPKDGSTLSVPIDDARALFEGKFWGQLLSVRHAAPCMGEGGSIVLFSGTLARKPAPGASIFAAIDGAIASLARVMAIDLSPIRVNVVAPGLIDTPMLEGSGREAARLMLGASASRVLVGRAGRPEDIAQAVLFLAGDTFVTGAVIDADGGKR